MAQRDLIYRRSSGIWAVKLQYADPELIKLYGKKIERSLGTKDKHEAQLLAAPILQEHRKRLLVAERRRTGKSRAKSMGWHYPLGISQQGDIQVFADEHKAILIHPEGRTETVQNGMILAPDFDYDPAVPAPDLTPPTTAPTDMEHFTVAPDTPRKALQRSADDVYFDAWKQVAKPTPAILAEATRAWNVFVSLGKPLKDCYRQEARDTRDAMKATYGWKSSTINKHLSYLSAIANIAIGDAKLERNPFLGVAADDKDALKRHPFEDAHMKLVRDNLDKLDADERKLWTLLATTGMRLGEAFQFDREKDELGIRYVITGSKTDASLRRVPLPKAFLDAYPSKIDEPLFPDETPKNLGKRLLRRIRKIGVNDPSLVLHSLRHRAADRLRAHECPMDIRQYILGHDLKTVAEDYGKGTSVRILKKWIDRIGY